MKPATPIEFAALVDAVSWPTEDQDIADVLALIRNTSMPPASADRLLRTLLRIAKGAAFGAGTQHGLALGEQVSLKSVRETLGALGTPRGTA